MRRKIDQAVQYLVRRALLLVATLGISMTIVLGACSLRSIPTTVYWVGPTGAVGVTAFSGAMIVDGYPPWACRQPRGVSWKQQPDFHQSWHIWPGPAFVSTGINTTGGDGWCVVISIWLFFLVYGALPSIALVLLNLSIRRHRRKHNRCIKCEYDLTGNESGVCPECGTRVK